MTEQNAEEIRAKKHRVAEENAETRKKNLALAEGLAEKLTGKVLPLSSAPDTEVPTAVRFSSINGVLPADLIVATSKEKAAILTGVVSDLAKLAGDFILSVKLWGVFDTRRAFLAEKVLNPAIWSAIQRGDCFVAYKKTSGGKSASRSISWEIDLIDAMKFADSVVNTSTKKVAEIKDRPPIF